MDKIAALKRKLRDFKPILSTPSNRTTSVITGIRDPPSYIVQYVLLAVLGLDHYGRSDKVWWQTYFTYKNRIFKVRDYKFGSWTIEGDDHTEEGKKVADEIKERISKACKVLDEVLYQELKQKVDIGDYHINNAHRKLVDIFEFHLDRTREVIIGYDLAMKKIGKMKPPNLKPPKMPRKGIGIVRNTGLSKYLNTVYRLRTQSARAITSHCFAMITSFYSLTEFLLEAIYAFERSRLPLEDFRKLEWNERFKLLFPIDNNKELRQFYNSFIDIKRNYRNPLTHGLADEAGRLVWLDFAGLVPLSYHYLSTKLNYDEVQIAKEDALVIMETFTKFLSFIESNEPYRYYLRYLSYGFPIPMNPKQIQKYKAEMTSFENFEEYMQQAMKHDAYVNRDVYPL